MTTSAQLSDGLMWRTFETSAVLAQALAQAVAAALADTLHKGARTVLVVSGGRTPVLFFEALSQKMIDWSCVDILPADERWVDESHPRSNAAMIRRCLLQNEASRASFKSLKTTAPDPESGLAEARARIANLDAPTVVVLGMGDDGHTASLFPGGDRLAAALYPLANERVETMRAPGAGEPRITLTAPYLLQAKHMFLHIEGETKRAVFLQACEPGTVEAAPIRIILRANRQLDVFWRI